MWNNVRQLNCATSALYALLLFGCTAAGCYWLTQHPAFALRTILIYGDTEHINAPTVRAGVVWRLKGNFFTVDLDTARVAFEQMSWVHHASVRRVWPNTLTVMLEEYKPLGTWGSDQLVSTDGELFIANQGEFDEELPSFDGPDGSAKEVVQRYRDFTKWFVPLGSAPKAVTLSSRYAWMVKLANGTEIEFGRERNGDTLPDRAQRLVDAWPTVTHRWGKDIEYADLRYPNGFAIRAANVPFLNDTEKANK
ncbi:MAG: cell division protein FtsQ/DivIB [Burkholderia sp.]|nr:MAG: Cell division protein FtsQ [Burkholderia gladioli]